MKNVHYQIIDDNFEKHHFTEDFKEQLKKIDNVEDLADLIKKFHFFDLKELFEA